ncbi:Uncharacterised protein [Mycobacteroides abscessus subsp. abscessus]|nr:Uncharacterised protein [Mycobacteroides abscessus subsp. abscessus]
MSLLSLNRQSRHNGEVAIVGDLGCMSHQLNFIIILESTSFIQRIKKIVILFNQIVFEFQVEFVNISGARFTQQAL